jgi:catechol 2,3-dioxygenase-like lactoylglutathione lyase family enzyme
MRMKLGSLPDVGPEPGDDGRLVVVSRDLTVCSDARHIAPTLRAALDRWDAAAPELDLIARGIEALAQPLERFHERCALAPLPAFGSTRFDRPRAAVEAGGPIAARIGFATVGGRLLALAVDFGGGCANLSPAAVTEDEVGHGTLHVRVSGAVPARIDAELLPPHLPTTPAPGVVALAPIAVLPFQPGDTIRVEYRDRAGHSVFGAIERTAAAPTGVTAIDHVLLAIPEGAVATCRPFYTDLLGLAEIEKPAVLAGREGAWFSGPGVELHVGADSDFRPARKAHPALRVRDLDALAARLAAAGSPVRWDYEIAGRRRFFSEDPVGNRIEFIAAGDP